MKEQIIKILESYIVDNIGETSPKIDVEAIHTIADEILALQLQQTGVMRRYFHPFVGAGTLIKETEKSLVIKLDFNGKEYFAPKHEFTELL